MNSAALTICIGSCLGGRTKAKVLIISSNILSFGDSNDMGTMTVTGGTNVVQYRLGFK